MANKNARERRVRENRKKIYERLCARLKIYHFAALGVCALVLLLFFCPWTQNYNFAAGVQEQALNGWQYFAAGISGNYTAAGYMGDFFNIYAQSYTHALAVLTAVSFFVLCCSAALSVAVPAAKKHRLVFAAVAADFVLVVLLVACCAVAFSMKDSNIYKEYCDPAQCEMRSYIVFPIVAAAGLLAVHIVAAVKTLAARKYLD